MKLLRLILRFLGRLRKFKLSLPHIDSHSWHNKEEILHDLKWHC